MSSRVQLRLPLVIFALACASLAGAQEPTQRSANDGQVLLQGVPPVPEFMVDRLNRYQNVRSAGFGDWSQDGRSIFITTRFGDVSQVHRVDQPQGARHQLTFYQEPVAGLTRRPGRAQFVFSMDEGGSEFYQLFLFDPAEGSASRLTDGASRNGRASWSRDGELLAFQSTRRNGSSNDVWVMDPDDPSSARMVFEAPGGTYWAPADWSPDGKRLLLSQYISVTDSRVHLLDLETGEARLVAGGDDEPGSFLGVGPSFDIDGKGFFLATDVEGEFTRLVHQDLETGARSPITSDIDWDVESLLVSEDGKRAAFSVNAGGLSELYLLDPVARTYRRVDGLPTGLVRLGGFSPDGQRLALGLNTPRTPSDVFVLDPSGDEDDLVRWTTSEVGGLDTARFIEPELIDFPSFDKVDGQPRRIPAFVYRPRGQGPHPVIVSIHGGPEGQSRPGFNTTYQMWVSELGAAVVVPNVRGSTGYGKTYTTLDNGMLREDSVKDIGALLDWVATQPDLDAERVAVYGGSYGGYMVLASTVHFGDRLAAAVDIVGISNFVTFLENTQDYRRDLRRPEYGDERDPEMREFLQRISPSRQAGKIRVPLFVAQGQNDPRVPVSEAEQIVAAVRQNGRDVWYMNALNEGHGFRKKANRDLYQQVVMMFFERHLGAAVQP